MRVVIKKNNVIIIIFLLIALVCINCSTNQFHEINLNKLEKMKIVNYESRVGSKYEKSLNTPKMSIYFLKSFSDIKNILIHPNNVPNLNINLKSINELVDDGALAAYIVLEDIEKEIISVYLNDIDANLEIGFQFDQVKIKKTSGGYPGRGQFVVESVETFPLVEFENIKKNYKVIGYGSNNIEILKSNRFLFFWKIKRGLSRKDNKIDVNFSDQSRAIIFFSSY
ncbi:hypothetical protein [Leptospira interrogans]|nr:hypothetical protein [Leptospira interrogans]